MPRRLTHCEREKRDTAGGSLLKKRSKLILVWALVLSVAAMIYLFSAQDGPASMNTSSVVVNWLLRLFHPEYDTLPSAEKSAMRTFFQYFVRKAAHFSEFALLGFSLRLLLHALECRFPFWCAWGIGTLYACTDELHQKLLGTRTAQWQDVGIDSAGVLFGALVMALILFLRKRRKEKKTPSPA